MLNNSKPKERFVDGDAYDVSLSPFTLAWKFRTPLRLTNNLFQQIARKCRSVQPKIQKWIAESAESDPGGMGRLRFSSRIDMILICLRKDRLLLMNDLINNIIKRYEAFKGGDRSATADVDVSYVVHYFPAHMPY